MKIEIPGFLKPDLKKITHDLEDGSYLSFKQLLKQGGRGPYKIWWECTAFIQIHYGRDLEVFKVEGPEVTELTIQAVEYLYQEYRDE